jgi:hypothetical protein
MVNSDKALQAPQDILPEDLDLIDYFILGKRKLINGSNLRIEYGAKAVKLIDRQNRAVGVSKQVNEWQQKILLYRRSIYLTTIQEKMSDGDFLLVTRTGHPDFVEYHKYQIPRGYQLFHKPANVLLKSWQEQHPKRINHQPNGIMIYQGNNWYPVQEVDTYKEIILLRTIISELTIGSEDSIIWIDRSEVTSPLSASFLTETPTKAMSIPITSGENQATVDATKSDLTSVFKTPVTAVRPAPEEVLTNLKNAIKLKALARLVDYLNDGETIINTEVLKDDKNNIISTKVTEINRGCPRWVIEQVKKF